MNILSYPSIPAVLRHNARKYAKKKAISYKKQGVFLSLTYEEFYERVLMLARGLRKVGMVPGDRVAIFSENRLGWALSDFGIQSAGGITVPIYATNTGKQAVYILNHCNAKIVFCSTRGQYEKLLAVKDEISNVVLVISYERFMGDRNFPVYTQYQLSEVEKPLSREDRHFIEDQIDNIKPDDIITIIYTSGTTGVPKGVLLTQRNIMVNAEYGLKQLGIYLGEQTTLSFLPLSHVLERTANYYVTLFNGHHIAFAENVAAVMENMTETSPGLTLSSAGEVRFDSVGKVIQDTDVRLAEDGELLVKGPQVMQGYFRNEQATREAFEDGWFKTGDIARIDEEGFVYIIDRKKELLVTAGGKNIAPQPIENELRLAVKPETNGG